MKLKSTLVTFLLFLAIIGIVSISSQAEAANDKVKNINPRVVDAFGNPLAIAHVDQQIQIASDLSNLQAVDQKFTFRVKIFKEGTMVSDAWITGSLTAGQSFSPALSWIPSETGTYTAQIFVIESVDNPVELGQQLSTTIIVESAAITVSTDKRTYKSNDVIRVFGKVSEYSTAPVSLFIISPSGETVTVDQVNVNQDKTFNAEFNTAGSLWTLSGTYTLSANHATKYGATRQTISFELQSTETPSTKNDTVPPLILVPSDMTVDASSSQSATVSYSVKVIDDKDGILQAKCTPSSGSQFQVGENLVTCTASDFSGNLAKKSFKVIVRSPSLLIPDWIKNVATFWCKDEIDNASFIEAIQYLIDNDVINVPSTKSGSSGSQEIPKWIKNTACWWSQGSISDNDFASGLQYLVANGIIKI